MAVQPSGSAVRAAALVVVLITLGTAGCGGGAASVRTPPATAVKALEPRPPGPLVTTEDLDEVLPGLSPDASLRPRWEVREQLWELELLRARCGADPGSAAAALPVPSGSAAVQNDAEQWWQGTTPQYATLDVLRWPGGGAGGPRDWLDAVVAAESPCREAVVLHDRPAAEGGPDTTVVVRRWEMAHSAGGPGIKILPLWQVGGFAVDGSTGIAVRAGAYSAPTAQAAWELARPGVTALVARAAQRSAPSPPSSSS